MEKIGEILLNLWERSGLASLSAGFADGGWQNLVMIAIACVLLYLAIVKKFEPLLLCGIAFGCLLTNLPGANLYNQHLWDNFMNVEHEAYHSYGTSRRGIPWPGFVQNWHRFGPIRPASCRQSAEKQDKGLKSCAYQPSFQNSCDYFIMEMEI